MASKKKKTTKKIGDFLSEEMTNALVKQMTEELTNAVMAEIEKAGIKNK